MSNKNTTNIKLSFFKLFLFLCSQITFSQNVDFSELEYTHQTFTKNDGYIIDELNSIEFDNDGWLWLSGSTYISNNYKVGEKKYIILRFNGKTFYPFTLPEKLVSHAANIKLYKAFDSSIYIKIVSRIKSRLLKIDPKSLKYTEIQLPKSENDNPNYELKKLKTKFLFVQQNENGNKLFYLNGNHTFSFCGKMTFNKFVGGIHTAEFDDKLIISKYSFGMELFSKKDGKLINKNFAKELKFSKKNILETSYYNDSTTYLTFVRDSLIYRFDQSSSNIVPTKINSGRGFDMMFFMFEDNHKNFLVRKEKGKKRKIQIFKKNTEKPIWSYNFDNEVINRTIFASRNLTQEIIFENKDGLQLFSFKNKVVRSYLNKTSIRSLLELNDSIILATTDYNGWYHINLNNNTTKQYSPLLNGKPIIPQFNRNLFRKNNRIWSNRGRAIFELDLKTNKIRQYETKDGFAAMTQNKDEIIFAAIGSRLYKFDKKATQFQTLIPNDTVTYEGLLFKNRLYYAATSEGLRVINDKSVKVFFPSNIREENYIVSLKDYKENSILLGTKSGKLYEFNSKQKTFKQLYKDELSASIASIIIDDKNRLWLNTFAGIVMLNLKTNETIRYGVNDGFSNFEANRFSSLKLKNGNLLVGTIRGLNYFNPDSLITYHYKKKLKNELQFVSIEQFNSNDKRVKKIIDREKLDSIKQITLPAENKNLVVNFSIRKPIFNIKYNYRYKLNNTDWIDVDKKNEIRLLNLQSGKYILEIQAIDKTKNQVISVLPLDIKVEQFFYQSIWFYVFVLLVITTIILIYVYKWREANKANFKNKLLRNEIEYKKKDLLDFATNISRNQQWNDYLISKLNEIQNSKGRTKGAALVKLEKDIKENNKVIQNNFEFQKRIDILSNEFYNSLLERFPKLSKTEIKLCSLIRLDLDNYDIATLQNIDISSVYTSRYRLRKKLNISSDTDLDAFLKCL